MGVVFDYYFDEPLVDGRVRVSGETDGLIVITAVGGVRSTSPQRIELSFDEASTLRALISQALFLKQDEQERKLLR